MVWLKSVIRLMLLLYFRGRFTSLAIVGAKHFRIESFSIKQSFQGDVTHLWTFFGHRYPRNMINISGTIFMK